MSGQEEHPSLAASAESARAHEAEEEEENSSQEHSEDSSGAVVVTPKHPSVSGIRTNTATATTTTTSSGSKHSSFLSRFDQFLKGYVAFTSTASNQDRALKLLQWTLWLFGYLKKSKGLHKLSLDVSWARYILRLLGFPASLEAARTGSWGKGRLGKIMAYSMMAYYPSEHVAYLGWMAPSVLPPRLVSSSKHRGIDANRWSAYSCRCWLVYLVAEMGQSVLKLKDLYRQQRDIGTNKKNDDYQPEKHDEDEKVAGEGGLAIIRHSIRNEQMQLVRSLLFTLPCIHWSLPHWDTDPWLHEGVVNGLMWIESVLSMYQSITNFRR